MPGRSRSQKVSYKKKAPERRGKRRQQKRRLVSARAGIVETKKKVNEPGPPFTATELLNEHNVMIPDAWEKQNQGLNDTDVVGTSIFMKYLTTRLYFNLNVGNLTKDPAPLDLRFIIGWCKLSQNLAPQDVAVPGSSLVKDVVYNYNPESHILQYLKASMDNPLESLDREVFKVDKDFRISGIPRTAYEVTPGGHVYNRKNFWVNHTWKPMKKLKLELVTAAPNGNGTHWSPCNKEGQWIPFVYVYNMNHAHFTTGNCATYLVKSTAYFTDS